MAQKVLSEAQMREYVEQEVRRALMNENIDEGIDEGLLDALAGRLLTEKVMLTDSSED